jgi:tetratricopeptide (TPR) repeat protein
VKQINLCRFFWLMGTFAVVIYAQSFQGGWQFDDTQNILQNTPLHLTDLSFNSLRQTLFAKPHADEPAIYRPVACLSLALNWYYGQADPFGYHLVNLLIHFSTGWILFLAIRLLFRTPRLRNQYTDGEIDFIAALASLFWLAHPIHTQAVVYIVQRMAAMAALGGIACVYCYLKGRLADMNATRIGWFCMAVISFLFGIFSKENLAILPLAIIVLDLIFFGMPSSRKEKMIFIVGMGLSLLVICILCIVLAPSFLSSLTKGYEGRPFSMLERILTQQRVMILYLSLLVFPRADRFSIDHEMALSTSLFSPWTTVAALIFHVSALSLAWLYRKKYPTLSFGVLFFYICHSVESSFIALELVFEHRNYLPSMFLFVPVAVLFAHLLRKRSYPTRVRTLSAALAVFVLFSLALGTYRRSIVWHDEESLWTDAMTKAPNSARPPENLAVAIMNENNPSRYPQALALYKDALGKTYARVNMEANTLANIADYHLNRGNYDEALNYFKKALEIVPDNLRINTYYARTLIRVQDFDTADQHIDIALAQNDKDNLLLFYKGIVQLWLGQPDEALVFFQKALRLYPKDNNAMLGVAKALTDLGYYEQGRWFYLKLWNNGSQLKPTIGLIENAMLAELADEEMSAYVQWLLDNHPLPTIVAAILETEPYRKVIPYDSSTLVGVLNEYIPNITSQLEDS